MLVIDGDRRLEDDSGPNRSILLQPFFNRWLERIQFAGSCPMQRSLHRLGQILGDAAPADVEMLGDLSDRPLLDKMEAMNRVDLFVCQHRIPLYDSISDYAIALFLLRLWNIVGLF